MVDPRPRLTLWHDGEYMLTSWGEDASSTVMVVPTDGHLRGATTTPEGLRTVAELDPAIGWLFWVILDTNSRIRTLRSELGVWGDLGVSTVAYHGGAQASVERGWDHHGEPWERVKSPSHQTPSGKETGNNEWMTVWHRSQKTADGSSARESVTYGTEDYKGHHSTYSSSRVVERDGSGHEVRRISVGASTDNTTQTQERSVTIRQSNGHWVQQIRRVEPDGSWTVTTSWNEGGPTTTQTVTGRGTTAVTGKTTTSDETPFDEPDGPEPPEEPGGGSSNDDESNDESGDDERGDDTNSGPPEGEDGAPTGDGSEPGQEGNPDGALVGISLRDLLEHWRGVEDLDTMGDLGALLRPWLNRIRGAMSAGGSGSPSTGELLDSLGAPPELDIHVNTGEGDDGTRELDSLGKPPPIFRTWLDLAEIADRGGAALTVAELAATAEPFVLSAAAVARSAPKLRAP